MIVHGGLVATRLDARWRGVLILGPSGIGKSDLALRTLSCGFRLVADDRVVLSSAAGRLFGRAPEPLEGLLEVRGLGIVAVARLRLVPICLAVNCVGPVHLERMPEFSPTIVLGVSIPSIAICPTEASAPAKLCRAIEVLGRGRQQDYDAAFPQTAPRGPT